MNWENMQLSKINKNLKKSYLLVFNRMAVLKIKKNSHEITCGGELL